NQSRIRPGLSYGTHAVGVARLSKLQFEQWQVGHGPGGNCHRLGCVQAEGVAGKDGAELTKSCKLGDWLAGAFRLEIPKRAVECITGRAGRQFMLQSGAVEGGVGSLDGGQRL